MRGRDCYDNRSFDFNLTSKNNPHIVLEYYWKRKNKKEKQKKKEKMKKRREKVKKKKGEKKKKNKPWEFRM